MAYSRLASPNATLGVLKEHGLYTRKSFGQHFLIDDNIVGRILRLADIAPGQPVLEIGPGIGTLTVALCERAGHVLAVEHDVGLRPVLSELEARHPNLTVLYADAVKVDPEELLTPLGPPESLVANLPYAVAATVVLRSFQESASIGSATVMVQAEVADRMMAPPGTKSRGAYTVKLGLLACAKERFPVSASCFLPPPRVGSAVVRLERRPYMGDPADLEAASRAADAAFAQRRKTLRNSMKSTLVVSGDELDDVFATAGLDGSVRAECLETEEFLLLGSLLRERGLLPSVPRP